MKKIIFTMVGSMMIGVCAVTAQQTESDGTTSKRSKQQKNQTEQTQQQDSRAMDRGEAWQQQSDRNSAQQGMVVIEKEQLPESVKEKLQDDKYAGWENATIYHNTNTGEYVIAPRAYRFDEQGKEIEMSDADRYSYQQGRTSRYSDRNDASRAQQSPQGQAREHMGEIPTSAPETDTRSQSADQHNNQSSDDQSSQSQSATYGTDKSSDRQQPSTGYRTGQDTEDATSQSQPGQPGQNQYSTEGMVEVQTEQIPASLRRTLSESQYKGWEENGTLYQDPSTSEYVLVMDNGSNTSSSTSTSTSAGTTYRFDKNGKLQEDENQSTQSKNNGQ